MNTASDEPIGAEAGEGATGVRHGATHVRPKEPAIRVIMMPRDTNAHGTIFGGHVLSLIDQAGAIAAQQRSHGRVVTVSIREVIFGEPVAVGDIVSCYASVVGVGRTSIRVEVEVVAERPGGAPRPVTSAQMTFVNVDDSGRPRALPEPLAPDVQRP